MKVTIFGGARPIPEEPGYQQALHLGQLLAKQGHTVITGGYCGTMEAVSKGASEAGGHVIGVTCVEIEKWRPKGANQWVREEWRCETLQERMITLMDSSDAVIALPGGAGTLAEITLLWNRMIVNSLSRRPLILVGEGWRSVFSNLFLLQQEHIGEREREYLTFASTIDEALIYLKNL